MRRNAAVQYVLSVKAVSVLIASLIALVEANTELLRAASGAIMVLATIMLPVASEGSYAPRRSLEPRGGRRELARRRW